MTLLDRGSPKPYRPPRCYRQVSIAGDLALPVVTQCFLLLPNECGHQRVMAQTIRLHTRLRYRAARLMISEPVCLCVIPHAVQDMIREGKLHAS